MSLAAAIRVLDHLHHLFNRNLHFGDEHQVRAASAVFNECLQIRKSSKLFRLETADAIQRDLTFLNTGPDQIPGLIVMRLQDNSSLDAIHQDLIVLFNAQPNTVTFNDATLKGNYVLHPVQQNSVDEVVMQTSYANNIFSVPGRTTAVFVIKKESTPAATAEPTIIATPATETNSDSLTIAGIVAAILALLGLGIFLRRKKA